MIRLTDNECYLLILAQQDPDGAVYLCLKPVMQDPQGKHLKQKLLDAINKTVGTYSIANTLECAIGVEDPFSNLSLAERHYEMKQRRQEWINRLLAYNTTSAVSVLTRRFKEAVGMKDDPSEPFEALMKHLYVPFRQVTTATYVIDKSRTGAITILREGVRVEYIPEAGVFRSDIDIYGKRDAFTVAIREMQPHNQEA